MAVLQERAFFVGGVLETDDASITVIFSNKRQQLYMSKVFLVAEYKTIEDAKEAAWNWRLETSHELDLCIPRHTMASMTLQQFVAGFMDGDGSITFRWKGSLNVHVGQSAADDQVPKVLRLIQHFYGGGIIRDMRAKEKEAKYNPAWIWHATGKNTYSILMTIAHYGIMKAPQALIALECFNKESDPDRARFALSEVFKKDIDERLSAAKKKYAEIEIDKTRLCDAYLSGFADAEGCVTIVDKGNTPCLQFTQHGSPKLLAAINIYLHNTGSENFKHGHLRFAKESALSVMKQLREWSQVKAEQIDFVLQHFENTKEERPYGSGRPRSSVLLAKDMEAMRACKRMKHYHQQRAYQEAQQQAQA